MTAAPVLAASILAGFLGQAGSWTLVILGVGLLIFIHELGHFLVAKWAGVRVLAFSLGFGPEMAGVTRGPTRYRIGWIPIGGYVKMSGETELPEGGYAPDDYPSQPVARRALIIVAGVAMNAVLAFVLFAVALSFGLPPVVVGSVRHGGPAWEAGIRPGDRVVRAGGERIFLFPELPYAFLEGNPVDLELERDGRPLRLRVAPRADEEGALPSIGISPGEGRAFTVSPEGKASKAGFRDGDVLVAVEGIPASLEDFLGGDLLALVGPASGPLHLAVENGGVRRTLEIPPQETKSRLGIVQWHPAVDFVRGGGPAARDGWKPGDRPVAVAGTPVTGWISFGRALLRAPAGPGTVRVARREGTADLPLPAEVAGRLALLDDLRFGRSESPTAVEVDPSGPSPAAAAGIPSGARIDGVNGALVTRFSQISERLRDAKGSPVEVAWTAGGVPGKATVKPADYAVYGLAGLDLEVAPVDRPLVVPGVLDIPGLALGRCVATTDQILATVGGIFRGKVRKENLGGPILIAQVAHGGTQSGVGNFLWILATLSVNLMFLNILPIPLLDGGQLALLAVEAVTRKPPSEAVVGISQMVGLALLLGLMVMVTFNDIVRMIAP